MVLGELPFVSSRDTHISSQERRKYLLSQINRGLAPIHRKALAHFSIGVYSNVHMYNIKLTVNVFSQNFEP